LWILGSFAHVHARDAAVHYGRGDVVSPQVFVTDKNGSEVSLRSLLQASGSDVNVLYIFGGGDLGFVAVAVAPVYHSQQLGAPAGVFLNEADDDRAFRKARRAFIDSTLAAFDAYPLRQGGGRRPASFVLTCAARGVMLHPDTNNQDGDSDAHDG
jgi:hypothetical protein